MREKERGLMNMDNSVEIAGGRGLLGMKGLSKKEKELVAMSNISVVIVGGRWV